MADSSFQEMLGGDSSFEDMIDGGVDASFEDMLEVEKVEAPPAPTTQASVKKESWINRFLKPKGNTIQEMMLEAYRNPSKAEVTWTDEPLHEAAKKALVDVGKTQGENVLAAGELAMNLASSMMLYMPSKLYGTMALPFGREVADLAEEEMVRLGYQPNTEAGKKSAELIGKGFELFLTPARNVGDYVSQLDPEAGYLVEFGAELAEFAMTGGIAKGVKAKFKPRIAEARRIIEEKNRLEKEAIDQEIKKTEGIASDPIRIAQQKILEAEKIQADLRRDEALKNFEKNLEPLAQEELMRKAEEVAKAKTYPIQKSGLKKLKKPVELKEAEVTQPELRYEGEQEGLGSLYTIMEGPEKGGTFSVGALKEKGIKAEERGKVEPTTDLDLQTGTPEPSELDFESHPFREKPEVASTQYGRSAATNVDELVSPIGEKDAWTTINKSLAEVNEWTDGKDIDISKTRDLLSEMAARKEEMRGLVEDFETFEEVIDEAAIWARRAKRKGDGETKLYDIGGATAEGVKQLKDMVKNALEFATRHDRAVSSKDLNIKLASKMVKEDVSRAFIDQSETIFKALRGSYPKWYQRIVSRQRSVSTGSGYGVFLYEQAMKEAFRGMSKAQERAVDIYMKARRFKDIYGYRTSTNYKHAKEYGVDQTISMVTLVEMARDASTEGWEKLKKNNPGIIKIFGDLSKKHMEQVIESSEMLFDWSRKIVDDLIAAGMKTPEAGAKLKSHDFRKFTPLEIEKLYGVEWRAQLGKEEVRTPKTGVEALGKGKTAEMEPSTRVVFHTMFRSAYDAIADQAAKLEWEKLAEEVPDNTFVSTKAKHGWQKLDYMNNGKKDGLYFNPEVVKYLFSGSKDLSPRMTALIRGLTLAPITKTLAVGSSPVWATLAGVPMDTIHSLWTARTWDANATGLKITPHFPFFQTTKGKFKMVYNPYIPGMDKLQIGSDIARVWNDVKKRGPLTKKLAEHGLMMNFLTQRQSRYSAGVKPPGDFAKMLDLVSSHGLRMELLVREAVADRVIRNRAKQEGISYEKALENDDILYDAVHASRDRMDYHQGGWFVRGLDHSGFNFLNAGVLGTRTFWRQAVDNPTEFAARTARIGATAAGITAAAWSLYGNGIKDVPVKGNERNATWPIVPNWLTVEDADGNECFFYFKLRMDPNSAMLYKIFEGLTKTYMYDKGLIKDEPDYNEIIDSIKKLGPTDISLPPLIQGWYDYSTNYSWWKDRQMYTDLGGRTLPWPESRHEGEFDKNVPQLTKDIGKVTGASPKRLAGAGSNVIPYNNEFVWATGKLYELIHNDVPKEVRSQNWLLTLAELPGFNRIIGVARKGQGRFSTMNEIEDEVTLNRLVEYGKLQKLAEEYAWYGARKRRDVTDYIYEFRKDVEKYDDMMKVLERAENPIMKKLPHRSFWLSFSHKSLEGKAKTFVKLLNESNKEERSQLWSELSKVQAIGGIVSDEFFDEVNKQYIK